MRIVSLVAPVLSIPAVWGLVHDITNSSRCDPPSMGMQVESLGGDNHPFLKLLSGLDLFQDCPAECQMKRPARRGNDPPVGSWMDLPNPERGWEPRGRMVSLSASGDASGGPSLSSGGYLEPGKLHGTLEVSLGGASPPHEVGSDRGPDDVGEGSPTPSGPPSHEPIREGVPSQLLRAMVDVFTEAVVWVAFLTISPRLTILVLSFAVAYAVCPGCAGNADACTYEADGNCPSIASVAANTALLAGVGWTAVTLTTAATGLKLTGVLGKKFIRIFTSAHLDAVLQLAKRPAPGTIFEVTPTTKIRDVLAAIHAGRVTRDHVLELFAGFIDDAMAVADNEAAVKLLMTKFDLIKESKGGSTSKSGGSVSDDNGLLSWLWGKVTHFVSDRGMQVRIEAAPSSSSSSTNVMTTTVKRFTESRDFYEALNLYIMYVTALGVASAMVVTQFLQVTVYDPIRAFGKPWQVAHELLVIMLRRIEDSDGKLTLGNCEDCAHSNEVMTEAVLAAQKHYPTCMECTGPAEFFRTRGGTPQGEQPNKPSKWNGKWTSTSKEACYFYNTRKADGTMVRHDDTPAHIHPDGTCRRNHVCDQWVSNKGPGGRCMGSAGTSGHHRGTCDYPNRCDARVQ